MIEQMSFPGKKRLQPSEVLKLESTSALVLVGVLTGIITPLDQGLSQMFSFLPLQLNTPSSPPGALQRSEV